MKGLDIFQFFTTNYQDRNPLPAKTSSTNNAAPATEDKKHILFGNNDNVYWGDREKASLAADVKKRPII